MESRVAATGLELIYSNDQSELKRHGGSGELVPGWLSFPRVTPQELIAARQRLGLSTEGLAAELNLTPAVIAAWEAGKIRPTRRAQRWLVWRGAMLDRDEALAASGLPECAALRDIVAQVSDEPRAKAGPVILSHLASCQICLARKQYLAERFPPLPPAPIPFPYLALIWAQRTAERFWQRLRGHPST